ncbi:copper resistance protein CopC [Microbacter sp. GSS18]|nr:copper resistance protein CopC [Microbacter sp. GSS18]
MSAVRLLSRLAAGAALAAAFALGTAAPASAHDDLVRSDPAEDAALAAAPAEVTLEFSDEVLTIGAVIVVADASGADWVDGELEVREGTVVAHLADGMPDAGYEVRWRVVSADGHPISGLIPFTVGDADPLVRDASADAAGGSGAGDGSAAGATPTQITQEGGIPRVVLIGGAGAAVAAAGFAAFTLIRRRARVAGGSDPSADAAGSEDRKELL